ncbi:DUF3127 domain-containing protein [Chryseobacterium sp.]|uniref:DUF3127 domain-containing protein n=1 Tax=Chryseobacterium sp. TaxID=1871047 RepID=UPI003219B80F
MKITGRIKIIGDMEVFSNGKKKQSLVISTFETKPREFEIHFYDEKTNLLINLIQADTVTIRFTLDSEVFEDKHGKSYFTHIIGLEILYKKGYY